METLEQGAQFAALDCGGGVCQLSLLQGCLTRKGTGAVGSWLLDWAFVVTQRLTAASRSASDVCLKGYSSQEFKSPLPLHLFLGVWQASL